MRSLVALSLLVQLLVFIAGSAVIKASALAIDGLPGRTRSIDSLLANVDSLAARSGESDPPPLRISEAPSMPSSSTSQPPSYRLPLPPPGQKAPLGSRYHPIPPPPKGHKEPPRKTRSDIGPERPAYPLPLPKTYSADFSSSRHQPRKKPKRLLGRVVKSLKSFKKLFGG
jgi:hypothetical protein